MGDQVGHCGIQRNQRRPQVGDVAIIHFLDQAMGQIGLIQQSLQPFMAGHQCRWLQEELFSHLEHRLDLRLDPRFQRNLMGRLQQFGHLFDIGADKTL